MYPIDDRPPLSMILSNGQVVQNSRSINSSCLEYWNGACSGYISMCQSIVEFYGGPLGIDRLATDRPGMRDGLLRWVPHCLTILTVVSLMVIYLSTGRRTPAPGTGQSSSWSSPTGHLSIFHWILGHWSVVHLPLTNLAAAVAPPRLLGCVVVSCAARASRERPGSG